jgi:hypothetical protein
MNTSTRTRFGIAAAFVTVTALAAGAAYAQSSTGAEPPAARAAEQPSQQRGADCMGGMRGSHAMLRGHGARGERAMMGADANGDGRLGRDELQAAHRASAARAMQAFDAADTDKDGVLTADERRAFRESRQARAGGERGAWRRLGPSGAPGAPGAPAPARPDAASNPGA